MGDSTIDSLSETVTNSEFKFVVPHGQPSLLQGMGQGPYDCLFVFGGVRHEDIKLTVVLADLCHVAGDLVKVRPTLSDGRERLQRRTVDDPEGGTC